jgi:hypothetical protein
MHISFRSVRAAKRNADAALLNAKAVINAERTWLDMKMVIIWFALRQPRLAKARP